jgi:transposase-like protein
VLKRYEQQYPDFGPTLACEYLAKEGYELDPETLRRWLLSAGLWKRRRKRKQHRKWRERRAQCGELIQMDGSHHDWFEGRREWAVLMVMIDDATNRTYARFYEGESTHAAMDIFARYVRRRGLPQALYVDKDSIYRCERQARIDEELRGDGAETQFARGMRQLQVDLILANSPQAKGRVERRNAVFQDRLVKALRLEDINDIEAANDYLETCFLKDLNRRFTCRARQPGDLHRRMPQGLRLNDVLGWQEPRQVQNNWTIRWRNRFFQIHQRHQQLSLPQQRVVVFEPLRGPIQLRYRGLRLRFKELPAAPVTQRPPASKTKRKPNLPAADHPWKQSYKAYTLRQPRGAVPFGFASGNSPTGHRQEKGTLLTS